MAPAPPIAPASRDTPDSASTRTLPIFRVLWFVSPSIRNCKLLYYELMDTLAVASLKSMEDDP